VLCVEVHRQADRPVKAIPSLICPSRSAIPVRAPAQRSYRESRRLCTHTRAHTQGRCRGSRQCLQCPATIAVVDPQAKAREHMQELQLQTAMCAVHPQLHPGGSAQMHLPPGRTRGALHRVRGNIQGQVVHRQGCSC
jgi:hypothetical protein